MHGWLNSNSRHCKCTLGDSLSRWRDMPSTPEEVLLLPDALEPLTVHVAGSIVAAVEESPVRQDGLRPCWEGPCPECQLWCRQGAEYAAHWVLLALLSPQS